MPVYVCILVMLRSIQSGGITRYVTAIMFSKDLLHQRLLNLHTSASLSKVKKGGSAAKDKKIGSAIHHAAQVAINNEYLDGALKEMGDCEHILAEQLGKHFSTKVDTRIYEEIPVSLNTGKEVRLGHLARVSLKGPRLVAINMSDSPSNIKEAKLALQKAGAIAASVQQEGVFLYIQVPIMSRERREQLASEAHKNLFNQFKDALNKIYAKYDKKAVANAKTDDEAKSTRQNLLVVKNAIESRGHALVDSKKEELLREVV